MIRAACGPRMGTAASCIYNRRQHGKKRRPLAFRLIVWCRDCRHQIEPDPAEMAERYGADLAVRAWVKRLKCSQCGSRSADFVLTGARR
jgi:hypothetical protein